jgi:fatty acid desaturase
VLPTRPPSLFLVMTSTASPCRVWQPNGWAQIQVETSANYAVDSLFWSVASANVNVQIEHHLFPGMASDRLQALMPVVKETCRYAPAYPWPS